MRVKRYVDPGIAGRLNEVMIRYGSDSTWGELLGCNRKAVWGYRHGVSAISADMLRDVCRYTKTSADYILFGGKHGKDKGNHQADG